ncbi:MAG: O-sialoglycoprotein endopeptidase [Christensenellales bacterium]|jgi:N6-L-threonylcarbamoyladenine synthase
MAVLGIDTSLYKTSCALADEQGRVVASASRLLPVAQGALGLRQNDAVFLHVRQFPDMLSQVLAQAEGYSIQAVAVSSRPSDAEDSYMPVFEVGRTLARSLALAWQVPVVETTHQRGHLRAAMIGTTGLPKRFLAVHLSGGTTDILLKEQDGSIALLAKGLDLHAGQLVDRVGVALGLSFPAGPQLDALAMSGAANGRYAVSIREGGFHLSGAETAALQDVKAGVLPKADIAANTLDVISRSLLRVLDAAAQAHAVCDVLIFGGVAASQWLRRHMQQRNLKRGYGLNLHFGLPEYSGDNAAGVALIGVEQQTTEEPSWQKF